MSEAVTIKQALEKTGVISINPKGRSMYPYIRDTYTVIIRSPVKPFKKYDCVLFFEKDNVYVLHRVVKIDGDFLTTAGDNNPRPDRPVSKSEVVGVLDGFYKKNGKYVQVDGKKTPFTVRFFCVRPFKAIRRFFFRLTGFAARVMKKRD